MRLAGSALVPWFEGSGEARAPCLGFGMSVAAVHSVDSGLFRVKGPCCCFRRSASMISFYHYLRSCALRALFYLTCCLFMTVLTLYLFPNLNNTVCVCVSLAYL